MYEMNLAECDQTGGGMNETQCIAGFALGGGIIGGIAGYFAGDIADGIGAGIGIGGGLGGMICHDLM